MVANLISGFSGFRQLAFERVIVIMCILSVLCILYIGGDGLAKYGALRSCIRQARVVGRQICEIGPPELIDEKYFNTGCIGEFRGFPVVPGIPKTSIEILFINHGPISLFWLPTTLACPLREYKAPYFIKALPKIYETGNSLHMHIITPCASGLELTSAGNWIYAYKRFFFIYTQ